MGLALAFGVLKVLNVAHGELLMLGGYIAFFAFTFWGLDPFVALPLVFIVMFGFGVILYLTLFSYVARNRDPRPDQELSAHLFRAGPRCCRHWLFASSPPTSGRSPRLIPL